MVSPKPGTPGPKESASPPAANPGLLAPASLCVLICGCAAIARADFARPLMEMRAGPVNGAGIFTFSQLLIAWIAAAWYVRATGIFDTFHEPARENARSR